MLLTDDNRLNVESFLDTLLSKEINDALNFIKELMSKSINIEEEDFKILFGFHSLISSQFFIKGTLKQIEKAINEIEKSITTFEEIDKNEFIAVSKIFYKYYSDLREISQGNYHSEKFSVLKKELLRSEKFILLKPGIIMLNEAIAFSSGGKAKAYTLENQIAEILFNKAGESFVSSANLQFKENSKIYNLLYASGFLQKSMVVYINNITHLNDFNFEYFNFGTHNSSTFKESLMYYTKALELLNLDEDDSSIKFGIRSVKGIQLASEAFWMFGKLMHDSFSKDTKVEKENIIHQVVEKIQSAKKLFVEIESLEMVNVCKMFLNRVQNINSYMVKSNSFINTSSNSNPYLSNLKLKIAQQSNKELFSKENITEILSKLNKYESINEILMLSGRVNELNRQFRVGIVEIYQYNIELNKIRFSFLEFIDSIE